MNRLDHSSRFKDTGVMINLISSGIDSPLLDLIIQKMILTVDMWNSQNLCQFDIHAGTVSCLVGKPGSVHPIIFTQDMQDVFSVNLGSKL